MELDFGPAEPPSQPPNNPPPTEESEPTGTQPTSPVSPLPPPPPPPPPATEAASVAQTQAVPVKGKGKRRVVLLVVGLIIIVAGLVYLGLTSFGGRGGEQLTEEVGTVPETFPDTTLPTPTTPTPTPTTTTPSTPTTAVPSETVQTRDAIRKKDLATIQTYLESYFTDKAAYPISAKVAKLNDPASSVVTALVPKYTAALPRDPKDPEFFYGYKSLDGKSYTMTARLENTADPEGKQEGSVFLYSVTK